MGYTLDDLYGRLKEIESLIHEKTNPDGSCSFDLVPVLISLELTKKMILTEQNTEEEA